MRALSLKVRVFAAIVLALVFRAGDVGLAQPQTVLTISPLRIELKASPGKTVIRTVTVGNSGSGSVSIVTSAEDFVAGGEGGKPRFVPAGESSWSMSGWVKATPDGFVLQPQEKKKVEVSIRVPKNAEPGGHYAAVLFSSAPSVGQQTAIVAKLGSLILLKVAGKIVEKGRITSLAAPRLVERGPINLELRFRNEGNVHLKPEGKLKVWGLWGPRTAELSVGGQNVLPRSTRLFSTKWAKVPSFGVFFARGRLAYGEDDKVASSPRATIFVMPWRLMLVAVGIFVLGLLLGFLPRRRKKGAG